MRRFNPAPALVVALTTLGALPQSAQASGAEEARIARPKVRAEIHGSTGVALVMSERRFASDTLWALPWSLGLGALIERGPWFKATIGAAFEHRVMFFPEATVHGIHGLLETRVGAGTPRVWGYGLAGVGPAVTRVDWELNSEDHTGIVAQVGAGVRGRVGRRVFVGGELDFDLGYYFPHPAHLQLVRNFSYHTVTFEFVAGVRFGGRRR